MPDTGDPGGTIDPSCILMIKKMIRRFFGFDQTGCSRWRAIRPPEVILRRISLFALPPSRYLFASNL
jgi:hypothetical protein